MISYLPILSPQSCANNTKIIIYRICQPASYPIDSIQTEYHQLQYIINIIYSMKHERITSCDICRRLGKTECGYHQFKNQYLSRIGHSCLEENQFAQTQSSIHRKQERLVQSNYARTLTPTKINNQINFSYQQGQSPFRQIALNSPHPQPQSRVYYTPPKTQLIPQVNQMTQSPLAYQQGSNYITRIEGGQMLYYPIYPVYEIVYEPDQLCVKIDIADNEVESPKRAQKVQNRRYKKLKELRENGFFSEDSIKLRHPLLYHNYLGNHSQRNTPTTPAQSTLSEFLQKNLLNLEYKARLQQQLNSKMHEQKKEGLMNEQQWQTENEMRGELLFEEEQLNKMNEKAWEIVEEEEIELEQQNLIDHAEQLFLEGKIDKNYINYKEIDNNSDYDELDEQNRDAEDEYFREQEEEQDQEINRKYYTGVQDF